MRRGSKVGRTIAYILLITYAIISFGPFVWALLVSITPMTYEKDGQRFGVDIMQWPPKINLFSWPPRVFGAPATLSNYRTVFEVVPYARWILNTVIYAGLTTLGHLLFDSMGGYAFARLRFPGKNLIFTLFLATMMVPAYVTIIPVYNLMVRYNLVNTYAGLFLPKLTGVVTLFMMRQFFLNLPTEIEEAAIIDGAGVVRRFFQIALPMAKPALAALAIYTFLGTWNDFLWPLLMTSDKSMFTLTMGLNFFRTSYYTFWQLMMAATLFMTLPMVIVFLSFQRYFIESGVTSGLKG
ncbi:MAG: multiple sugar transport system permease protein [Thermotogota bacterium]|nr:multiple sugar transport system permease protein [Thermotogota bacterium]MDK2865407.1 multiple sugar transport system permease protein [Thermotogota bacterium]HCZ07164.1 ABC transporter permease [Thermotogota bacterium]